MRENVGKACNVLVLFFACLLVCASTVYPQEKAIVLKYATIRGPSDVNAVRWQIPMAQEIERQTKGKVKIVHYWSESLGKGRDQFNLVRDGLADISDFPGAYIPGKFLISEVGNLPYAAKDEVNIGKAMNQMLERNFFRPAWGEVEVLGFITTSFYQILFKKDKPATFQDLAGKKVRTPGGYMTEFLRALGMIPITIPPAEAYQAWERGLVEAWMHPAGAFKNYKLYEMSNKAILKIDAMTMANAAVIFNKQKWASLEPELREIIKKVVSDYGEKYLEANRYLDEESYKLMKERGVEIYELSPAEMEKIKKASLSVWTRFISDVDKAGGNGKLLVAEFVKILRALGERPIYEP